MRYGLPKEVATASYDLKKASKGRFFSLRQISNEVCLFLFGKETNFNKSKKFNQKC